MEEPSIVVNSTEQVPTPKKSRKPFNSGPYVVGILLFLVICLLAALTYFILKDNGIDLFSSKTATTDIADNSSNTSTTNNTDNSENTESTDVCVSDKNAILSLVDVFETDQENRDADAVLSLFTPATEASDISDYSSINGYLYGNMNSNYKVSSYTVKSDPERNNSTCVVVVTEQRSYYGGATNPQWLAAAPYEFSIGLVQSNSLWKINTYESDDATIKSGKYQGFLMQYKYDTTVSVVYEGDGSTISSDFANDVYFIEIKDTYSNLYFVPKNSISLTSSSSEKSFTLSYDSTKVTSKLVGDDENCVIINGGFGYQAR